MTPNEATADPKEDGTCGKDDHYQKVLKKIDLSGLTHEQREQVRQMVREESSRFTVDSDDRECNNSHGEVKSHIEDLVNKK